MANSTPNTQQAGNQQASPQQGSTPAPTGQQQGQTTARPPQQGQPIYKDWASI